MRENTIGIIGAMTNEISYLRSRIDDCREERIYDFVFYTGRLCGRSVALLKCGIGKVNAARGAQIMIERYSPAIIVNTGIAGGVGPGLSVGDSVIASSLVQHDFDATAFGYAKGYLCTGHEPDRPTVFTPDKRALDVLTSSAKKVLGEEKVRTGVIATGDQFISSHDKKVELYETFGAYAAEMESCAIAQAAEYSGVPFAIIRVISDTADGQAAEIYETFENEAADRCAKIIEDFIQTY